MKIDPSSIIYIGEKIMFASVGLYVIFQIGPFPN
jgi:hypothetical protein